MRCFIKKPGNLLELKYRIVYKEFLPIVLVSAIVKQYGQTLEETSTFNATANPIIRSKFATVVF